MSMRICCGADENKPHDRSCKRWRAPETPVRVLSFGAGTQSSALLGLIEEGRVPPVDFAVFADTQAEPDAVYDWLEKIRRWAKTPIIVATKGSIFADFLAFAIGTNKRASAIPFHTRHRQPLDPGVMPRQCTYDYKISVVHKAVRERLGYKPRQRVKHRVEMLIAMSLEEVGRMKDSREKWITNRYPLIFDVPMHRQQSIAYVQSLGLGVPPRSSCFMCPFHSNAEWKWLRDNEPLNWKKAVEFDHACRQLPRMESATFLHESLKPLDQADLEDSSNQLDLFQNECEGMCGA